MAKPKPKLVRVHLSESVARRLDRAWEVSQLVHRGIPVPRVQRPFFHLHGTSPWDDATSKAEFIASVIERGLYEYEDENR